MFFYQFSLSGRQMIFSLPPLPISDFQKRLSLNKTRKLAESQTIHRGRNSKQINIPKYISKFFIYGAKMLDKCVKSQKIVLYFFLFCKVKLSKMASVHLKKQNQKTNCTFLIQFFMIYNFAFDSVNILQLKLFKMNFVSG